MNKEDTKIGETYLLPVTVTTTKKDGWIEVVTCNGYEYILAPSEVKSLLQNGIKNTEPAPKYDPCRKFRKGDKVRVAENKGRYPKPYTLKIGDVLTVSMDEPNDDTCVIVCKWHDRDFYLDPAYLELVTPVEERSPYTLSEGAGVIEVYNEKREAVKAWFYCDVKGGVKALAGAKAERDRLNAEWRKEQSND